MATKKKGTSARKKTAPKKKTNRRKKINRPDLSEFKKALMGLAVLLAFCLTLAMIADMIFKPGEKRKAAQKKSISRVEEQRKIYPIREEIPVMVEKKKTAGLKSKPDGPITYEVYKDIDPVIKEKKEPAVKPPITGPEDKTPLIAIIIDDIGYDRKTAMALWELDSDITFSVLPFSPFGRKLAERLNKKGAQLMLHLPMEPVEYPKIDPGPGAILSHMPPDVLLAQLEKSLENVPYVTGVNNHMGSRLTAHADQMNQIFSILKKNDLFFIDSRTAAKSKGKASARLLKVKFAQRDVFLDNYQEYDYIKGQLMELVGLAEKHGTAIGIGHPYKATLETLSKELPRLKERVKIVRASRLTHIPG